MLIIPEKVIKKIEGTAVPKPADGQNTDDMIYGGKLNLISFATYGKELFKDERAKDPNHPLNDPRFKQANILIGGENYGCGSSREHAPQGHKYYGFKGLVTAGYAGIFQGNCGVIGLVAVTIPKPDIKTLAARVSEEPKIGLSIDLESKKVSYEFGGVRHEIPLDIPENTRQAFLTGTWDAAAILRNNPEEVKAKMDKIPYFSFE